MTAKLSIAVIGTGYVGLTTGACLASLGHNVVCVDVDQRKIDLLRTGEVPILEEGLSELVKSGLAAGRLHFVLGAAATVGECELVFLCVPTPQAADGSADLSYLLAAVEEIKAHLKPGAVVVNKSTVPVGTAERVASALDRTDVAVASNPEFLREGTAVADFLHPDRIVIGASDPAAATRVAHAYAGVDAPKMLTDSRTAELIKYASNAFLAAKISFANSIGSISEEVGANAHDVLAGMGADHRIGPQFLKPGPGWGGSCFPKDTEALISIADSAGYQFDLLKAVIQANVAQTDRVISIIQGLVGGGLDGARIAVWGLSFKAGTDDTRQSPSLRIIARLVAAGAVVTAYDPGVKVAPPDTALATTALEAATGADALVVLTEWPEFGRIKPDAVAKVMAARRLYDTRAITDADVYAKLHFDVYVVGRGRIRPSQKSQTA